MSPAAGASRSTSAAPSNDGARILWPLVSGGLGGCLWIGIALAAFLRLISLGAIETFFLLAPLVVVPLTLALARSVLSLDGLEEPLALHAAILAQPVTAAAATLSFVLEPGPPAAALACAWLLTPSLAALAAVETILRVRARRQRAGFPTLCVVAGLGYVCVGGVWLVLSRAGLRPMGFLEPIPLLTALHYHMAGFAAPTLVGAAGMLIPPGRRALLGLHRALGTAAIAGPALLGTGWVLQLPALKLASAALMSAAYLAYALLTSLCLPRVPAPAARILLAVSASAAATAMTLAAAYAWGEYAETFTLAIPTMARMHGSANAFGFLLCGLIGWLLTIEGRIPAEKSASLDAGSASGPGPGEGSTVAVDRPAGSHDPSLAARPWRTMIVSKEGAPR